jgi:hypothetical protein
MSMNNLAAVLNSQGKHEEAEAMHRQTLAQREKVLGSEHPDTLMSIYCLAYLLTRQHRYNEAFALYVRKSLRWVPSCAWEGSSNYSCVSPAVCDHACIKTAGPACPVSHDGK